MKDKRILNEKLHDTVYLLFRNKGKELKIDGSFSIEMWDDYLRSLGCELMDSFGDYLIEEDDSVIVRDEHFIFTSEGIRHYPRVIKLDRETAMRIAILGGLP